MIEKKYLKDNKILLKEFDFENNTDIDISSITMGMNCRIWWKCKQGHSWQASPNNRQRTGCPICAGKQILHGFNDLESQNPDIAAEWYVEKNDKLPSDVTAKSSQKAWWKCKKGHSWQARISNRVSLGRGCPFCSNQKILDGYNDLITIHPELSEEWDYKKNDITPNTVGAGSTYKAWWKCNKFGHSWQAEITDRVHGNGCPFCSGRKTLKGFNDLATVRPDLVQEWNYDRNDLLPNEVTCGSFKKVWWRCSKGHSWEAVIYSRKSGNGCPYCAGTMVLTGFNDLATVKAELLDEWDYSKNKDESPQTVSAGTSRLVWWKCDKGHSWKASVASRVSGRKCPVCTGRKVVKGFNDLTTINPLLAEEWDTEKNSENPDSVTSGSSRKFWWKCSKGHNWKATVAGRMSGTGCPYCVGKDILPGFNDLKTKHPDVIAKSWDYEKNTDIDPNSIASTSRISAWWKCDKGHSWQSKVSDAVRNGCPICSNRRVLVGYNDLKSIHPDIARDWDYESNGSLTPEDVTFMTGRTVHWMCSVGHRYKLSVYCRHQGVSCPYCAGRLALKGFNSLADQTRDYTKEWDYERNVDLSPDEILPHSNRKVWWKCPNGHSYRSNLNAHNKGHGCPYCSGQLPSRTRIVP